jgi:hypothetical protein
MSDEIKPASPLPWKSHEYNLSNGCPGSEPDGFQVILGANETEIADFLWSAREDEAEQDCEYAVHAANEYPALVARVAALEEALGDVIAVCEHANKDAFANGVTDSTGGMDEGEVRSWEAIERARKALGLNTKGRGSDD